MSISCFGYFRRYYTIFYGGKRRYRRKCVGFLRRQHLTLLRATLRLNKETRDLIAAYRRNPSDENRAALREQVAKNYDAIVARKKAKLEELKRTAKHQSKVDEMQVIVDEMLRDREQRIEALTSTAARAMRSSPLMPTQAPKVHVAAMTFGAIAGN